MGAGRAGPRQAAAVILAAGAATRMGQLKQLLVYRGRTLIENTVRVAAEAHFEPIVIVVGAQADAVRGALAELPVRIVENCEWQSGMGSSIATGVRALTAHEFAAVAILLADQPLVTSSHLRAMDTALGSSSASAIAAHYGGTLGVPAIFRWEMRDQLLALNPDSGARGLLRNSGREVIVFPLPEAAMDVDTPEDFAAIEDSDEGPGEPADLHRQK